MRVVLMVMAAGLMGLGGQAFGQQGASAGTAQVPAQPVAPAASTPAASAPADSAAAQAVEIVRMKAQLEDWAQLARYRAADEALPPTQAGRVVFFGDSITDMWVKDGGKFFPGKPYVNRGISGQTTPQMLVRFQQDVIHLKPEVVVILAGTNDIAGNTGPSTLGMIEDNFRSMTDIAKANGIRVVLASTTPVARYPWAQQVQDPAAKIEALNAWLKEYCAQEKLVYLDYWSAMADKNGGMKPGISLDGVHPNAAGYAMMEPLAEAAIAQSVATP